MEMQTSLIREENTCADKHCRAQTNIITGHAYPCLMCKNVYQIHDMLRSAYPKRDRVHLEPDALNYMHSSLYMGVYDISRLIRALGVDKLS
jgi:hypothetical protein